jgi:hypothetical protein
MAMAMAMNLSPAELAPPPSPPPAPPAAAAESFLFLRRSSFASAPRRAAGRLKQTERNPTPFAARSAFSFLPNLFSPPNKRKDREALKLELLGTVAPLDRGTSASPDDISRVEEVGKLLALLLLLLLLLLLTYRVPSTNHSDLPASFLVPSTNRSDLQIIAIYRPRFWFRRQIIAIYGANGSDETGKHPQWCSNQGVTRNLKSSGFHEGERK